MFLLSSLFLPSFLAYFLPSCLPSFLPSCLPSFLPSFIPAFLSFLPSCLPSFLPSCLPSFLSAFLSVLASFLPSCLPSCFNPGNRNTEKNSQNWCGKNSQIKWDPYLLSMARVFIQYSWIVLKHWRNFHLANPKLRFPFLGPGNEVNCKGLMAWLAAKSAQGSDLSCEGCCRDFLSKLFGPIRTDLTKSKVMRRCEKSRYHYHLTKSLLPSCVQQAILIHSGLSADLNDSSWAKSSESLMCSTDQTCEGCRIIAAELLLLNCWCLRMQVCLKMLRDFCSQVDP